MSEHLQEVLVVGDVHGNLAALKKLIFNHVDKRVILVGDLIDRGPNSEQVIDFIRDNSIECVKGNHEYMAEEVLVGVLNNPVISDNDIRRATIAYDWALNGGLDVIAQYSSIAKLQEDITYLATLHLYIATDVFNDKDQELVVSHTYVGDDYKNTSDEFNYLWSRRQPKAEDETSRVFNVFGHTPTSYIRKYSNTVEPVISANAANIDTGCYRTNVLTGLVFPSMEVVQVSIDIE